MNQEAITAMINVLIATNLWKVVIAAGIAYILTKLLTALFNLFYDYIMIKLDDIGIGTMVDYKGKTAIVKNISLRKISLETNDDLIFIKLEDWKKLDIIIKKHKNISNN